MISAKEIANNSDVVICPETGCTIFQKKEWVSVGFGYDYKVSLSIINNNILLIQANGFVTLHDQDKTSGLISKIKKEYLKSNEGLVYLQDLSGVQGVSPAARKSFIKKMRRRKNISGLIFFNVSPKFKVSIKLGKRLNFIRFGTHIVNDYKEAVLLAQRILATSPNDLQTNVYIDTTHSAFNDMRKNLCHVTGLHKLVKPEWTDVNIGDSCRVSFEFIGDRILHVVLSGKLLPEDFNNFLDKKKEVLLLFFKDENEKYYEINNLAKIHMPSKALRDRYARELKKIEERLIGFTCYNVSSVLSMSINVGKRIHRFHKPFFVAKNYESAIVKSLETVKNFNKYRRLVAQESITENGWGIQLEKYFVQYELVGNKIIHVFSTGPLNESELDKFADVFSTVVEQLNFDCKPFYIVSDICWTSTSRRHCRKLYKRLINRWLMQNPFVKHCIFYGNTFRDDFSLRLIDKFINPKLYFTNDYFAACDLAAKDALNESAFFKQPSDVYSENPSLINKYVDEMLLFLGNINWEVSGVNDIKRYLPLSHPFLPVFESIALIKSDLDELTRERRIAANALKKNEERYRMLAENSKDVIWTANMNLQYTYLSPVFSSIFGYNINEFLGRCMDELLTFDSRQLVWKSFSEAINEEKKGIGDPEKTILLELETLHKEGFVIWTEVIISFTRSVAGDVTGVLGATRDITERIRAKEALDRSNMQVRKSNEDLRMTREQLVEAEKMAALGGLVAGVSHEISTPLGIGVTASSFLQQKTEEFKQAFNEGSYNEVDIDNYLKKASESSLMIFNNLRRAAALINSFKQVAVDQSNEFKREFDIGEYINSVIVSLQPEIKKSGHDVEVYCPDKLKYYSYPGAFSQVVTNLVMNTIAHGFDAGESGKLSFKIEDTRDFISFRYSDNGKGMHKETLDKIFDPFFTTQRASGGTGLGMHIVYNIVHRKLGGAIECESSPGCGASFLIKLPH